MTDILVRIESIYDLPIGKILKDTENFSILSSHNLETELDKNETILPHDVHIGDLDRRMGIQIKGSSAAVELIENTLQNMLPDSVLFKHLVQQDAIYYARVEKYIYRKKIAILDLGSETTGILFNYEGQTGDMILIQIKELTTEKDKLPVCSNLLTLSGNFVILEVGSSFVRVSRKIKGQERKRLHDIGKEMLPEGFGIIIRTSATNMNKEDLNYEIDQLITLWERIEDEIIDLNEPKKLVTGEVQSEIIFGHSSKTYFDGIRSEILPTLPNYHHFKAYSMATGFTLDFAQNYIETISAEKMSSKLYEMIIQRDYPVNNHIKAEFHFPDGTQTEVILGDITQNKDFFITRKTLTQNDIARTPELDLTVNDIMEVIFAPGSWIVHYKYYSGLSEKLIIQRVRITTPLDLIYRGRIRAFDMGMDIFYNEEEEEVIDSLSTHSELDMVGRKMISDELNAKLGEVYRYAHEKIGSKEKYIIYK